MKKRACACVCQKKVVPLQPVFEFKRKPHPDPLHKERENGNGLQVSVKNRKLIINRYEYYR